MLTLPCTVRVWDEVVSCIELSPFVRSHHSAPLAALRPKLTTESTDKTAQNLKKKRKKKKPNAQIQTSTMACKHTHTHTHS